MFKEKRDSHRRLPLTILRAFTIFAFNGKAGGFLNGWKNRN